MINIHLYLGAHKTATTHLQGILLANRDRLAAHHVALSAPQDVRKEWLPAFFRYCAGAGDAPDAGLAGELRSIAPRSGLWILTEENIAGVCNDFAVKPGIYPQAADRITCLARLFPDAELSLFFSLRSYDGFYRSAYTEVVRNRGYLPFEEFYDEGRFQNNSWVETVRRFQRTLPQERIILWKFEDFRELIPRLVSLLTGIGEVQDLLDAYKPDTTRPSLSRKTVEILKDLHPVLSRKESLALVERINRAYPAGRDWPSYRPFGPEQEAAFRQRYARDIEAIKADYPGIRFLEPAAGKGAACD
jgi:hypothetical protein